MKINLLVLILLVTVASSFGGNFLPSKNQPSPTTINALDTVVFDLLHATKVGNYLEVPVSILSDDTVNALDFSFKYDHSKLLYDSMIDVTSYMSSLAFYNTNDSVVRFTSNSFQTYSNDTVLVKIGFDLLSGALNANDLNTVKGMLNGNQCTVKIVAAGTVGIDEIQDAKALRVFPNPVRDVVSVAVEQNSEVQLFSAAGALLYDYKNVIAGNSLQVDVRSLTAGIYYVKIVGKNSVVSKKVVVE